jgi:hypothetical protein
MKNGMTLTERVLGKGAKARHELQEERIPTLAELASKPFVPGVLAKKLDRAEVERQAQHAADAIMQKIQPSDNAVRISGDGRFKIYSKAPPIKNPNIKRGYPWRELQVGEAFFAGNKHFKVNKHITGCADRIFTSYAGELDGKQGRWCKRIK